ncbi:MAG: guanylate kinase [Alphaproteobacteria bacterium]|nr:guanylate kinase [Alphaproteobacteria bacterium]
MSLCLDAWSRPDEGALFVVTGASGTGKTTLVKEALRVIPELGWSVSATTRAPREGEVDGRDYHFVSHETFTAWRDDGELLEWAEVYGNFYGTPLAPVREALASGRSILLEIDIVGARQVFAAYPGAVGVFILPPSLAQLEERLRGRATDSEAVIQRRLAEAMEQIQGCGAFHYQLVNDDLPTAHDCFQAILVAELLKTPRRRSLVERMTRADR